MTKLKKRRAAVQKRIPFTKEWLALQPDDDIRILAAVARQRLRRKPLPDEDAGRIRRVLEESERRTALATH